MENSRLREAASTSVNVTVRKRSREYLTDREVERLNRGRQAEPLWASGRKTSGRINFTAQRHQIRFMEMILAP
jgi:hypothetical protein